MVRVANQHYYIINLNTRMKMQSNKLRNWGLVMALLAIGNPLVTSCSKDQNSTELAPKSDKLTISISGINVDPSFKSASNDLTYDVKEFGDADIAITIGDINQSDAVKFRNSSVYEPVAQGVQYVVYIYEGNNLVTAKELSAGTLGTIEGLNPTTDYKWIAVSYNSTDSAPSLTPQSAALLLPENTDVLYATGDLNLSNSSSIEIAFNHAMARLAVELNTIGVFGEISTQTAPTITLTSGGLRTGSLNLLSGDITASSTTFSPTLTYSDFEQVEENKNDILQTYFYTVPNSASENQSVTVNISNLMINHYDGNQSRTYFTTAKPFPLSVAVEKGKSTKATLNIVESALETRIGTTNIGWARSNLYFREGEGIDDKRAYAFDYINRMHATGNSYFAFNTKKPLYFPQTAADLGDPCLEVYPKNLWRTPTKAELGALSSGEIDIAPLVDEVVGTLTNILDGLLGSILGGATAPNSVTNILNPSSVSGKTEYNTSIIQRGRPTGNNQNAFGSGTSQSNKLTFFYNGQVTNTTVLQSLGSAENSGLISLRTSDLNASSSGTLLGLNVPILPAYSNTAALWSNTDGINLLGLVGAGSWGYFSYQNVALGGLITQGTSNARTSAELLDLELLNIGLIESSLKNVRCVRSTAPVFN